jgi:hypothetical protein
MRRGRAAISLGGSDPARERIELCRHFQTLEPRCGFKSDQRGGHMFTVQHLWMAFAAAAAKALATLRH